MEELKKIIQDIERDPSQLHKPSMIFPKLIQLGMNAYASKEFDTAEIIFAWLSESNDSNGSNNYAYMIRRGETKEKSATMLIKAMYLLRDGITRKEAFSFVNMALLLALRCGTDSDWKLSDELMEKLPTDDLFSVQSWWEKVGNDGDIEGFLVHYFLLRHNKIKKSNLGDLEDLSKKLSEEIKTFPKWLIVYPRFKSLDDVFETMLDDDFEDSLRKYLSNMPRNRESADEILKEMTQWDEWELYRELLQNYVGFLSRDEISKIVCAYKKKFIVPLSSIVDESSLVATGKDDSED